MKLWSEKKAVCAVVKIGVQQPKFVHSRKNVLEVRRRHACENAFASHAWLLGYHRCIIYWILIKDDTVAEN